ncbi:MAG: thiamine-phosphate kinase [Methanomicrobiales archaeon]|nr:thiamine-phosphate kinase [Methanomicrobiales archaeon]
MDDRDLLESIIDLVGDRARDDCAVLPLGENVLVATTDMLHTKTDFLEGMTDWQCGWMAIAVTLSDIASMGATPQYILLAVGLDRPERLRPLMEGAKACCDRYHAELVGGDIDSHDELTLVSTGIGTVDPAHLVRRRGSRAGDLVCVTGVLGRARAAIDGFSQYRKALFEPQPRVTEGQILGRSGATSMMDISDGLALSLYDLTLANRCGYRITSAMIPVMEDIPYEEALEFALYGGGDYELLFTIPGERLPLDGMVYYVIGHVIGEPGAFLNGTPLERRGYQHRWKEIP